MSSKLMTYNFSIDSEKYRSHPEMIYATFRDKINGIQTTNVIPGLQCYVNYLDLLIMMRDKWISVGYLDLGMIPIIMGPHFMHNALENTLLPIIRAKGLKVYPMPGASFMLNDTMRGYTDYWAFRDDVAEFLGCPPERVTTKEVISKLVGVELE